MKFFLSLFLPETLRKTLQTRNRQESMISFCPRVVAASRQMLMLLHRVFFKVKPTQDEFSGVENALMGC